MNFIRPGVTQEQYIQRTKSRVQLIVRQSGNLVYIRMLKCASSFFHNNFQDWGWNLIEFDSIDWHQHHVFAHMLDPLERRYKGAAEYIQMCNMQDVFHNNPDFKKFVSTIPVFDEHTASYYSQLGDYCEQIDWIPISNRTPEQTTRLTEMLLQEHNISGQWNQRHARPADTRLRTLQLAVRDCLEQTYQYEVYRYLLKDIELHNRVCENFDASQSQWRNVSWLRSVTK